MLAANVLSAAFGQVIGAELVDRLQDASLAVFPRILPWVVAASFVVTLLVEWPFVLLCLRRTRNWWRHSIWASLLIQSVSYLFLLTCYHPGSYGPLGYAALDVSAPSGFVANREAVIYFFSAEDRGLHRISLDGTRRDRLGDYIAPTEGARLFARASAAPGQWNLYAGTVAATPEPMQWTPIITGVTTAGMSQWATAPPDRGRPTIAWYLGQKSLLAADLRQAAERPWALRFHLGHGLSVGDTIASPRRVTIWTQVYALRREGSYPTFLDREEIVFQLGDEICVCNLAQRKLVVLARGWCPVVALPGTDLRVPKLAHRQSAIDDEAFTGDVVGGR